MPELQTTIDNCGLSPAVAPSGALAVEFARPPLASYCDCGAPAIVENANGSACADCDEEFGNCVECNDCNEFVDRDDTTTRDGNEVCSSCDNNWTECNDCNCDVLSDDTHTAGGNEVCDSCRDNNYTQCDGCQDYESNDDLTSDSSESFCSSCMESRSRCESCESIVSDDSTCSAGDTTYCESCYNDNCFHCEGCSESYHNDDCGRYNYCSGCWDGMDCDERAEAIVANDHPVRVEYRDRPASAAPAANPVRSNKPYNSDCCQRRPFAPGYNGNSVTGSYRTYGVELETSSCPGAEDMSGRTVFASSSDGSVDGWEFGSAVLNGDAGLNEIDKFCELAEENSFAVDSKCGFHAHFHVGDESNDVKYNIAIAYWMFRDVWTAFVSSARRNNRYCAALKWRPIVYGGTVSRIERDGGASVDLRTTDYSTFAGGTERRAWFNVASYVEWRTYEVRLHSGTISAKKVKNWVVAHLRFVELVSKMSREEIVREFHNKPAAVLFARLLEIMPPDVATYLTERAEQFGATFTTEPAAVA